MSFACEPVDAVDKVEEVDNDKWLGVLPRVARRRLSAPLIISSSSMSDLGTDSLPPLCLELLRDEVSPPCEDLS